MRPLPVAVCLSNILSVGGLAYFNDVAHIHSWTVLCEAVVILVMLLDTCDEPI